MLNTRQLGGEGVPFFSIIFVPWMRRAPRSGIFERIIEDKKFFSSHTSQSFKVNCKF
jgi:hypothetical protein